MVNGLIFKFISQDFSIILADLTYISNSFYYMIPKLQKLLHLALITSLLVLTACSSNPSSKLKAQTPQALYQDAKTALDASNYLTASEKLEQLESRFPFGPFAQQALLDLIFVYHQLDDPASALATAERFIRLNPNHENVDYAYYMKGLVNFNVNRGFLQQLLETDTSKRDAGAARQAFQDFSELLRRFPESKYANDARQRMIYLRNDLAKYEVHVARFYMRQNAYVAAINRAKYVVKHFSKTPAVADALALMARAYDILELPELSEKARRTLKLNYPDYAYIE